MKAALRCCESVLMAGGIVLLAVYIFFRMHAWLFQAYDSWSFDQVLKEQKGEEHASSPVERSWTRREFETRPEVADYRDWAPSRTLSHEKSLKRNLRGVIGRLLIPSLKLNVMVLEGTDPWTLNRAVGHIESTSLPGQPGNVAISAHRDGYFRNLGRMGKGDEISIVTPDRIYKYAVQSTEIVNPEDIGVLASSNQPVLTLVTCFPFYFVGEAPQRFIVKARLVQ